MFCLTLAHFTICNFAGNGKLFGLNVLSFYIGALYVRCQKSCRKYGGADCGCQKARPRDLAEVIHGDAAEYSAEYRQGELPCDGAHIVGQVGRNDKADEGESHGSNGRKCQTAHGVAAYGPGEPADEAAGEAGQAAVPQGKHSVNFRTQSIDADFRKEYP